MRHPCGMKPNVDEINAAISININSTLQARKLVSLSASLCLVDDSFEFRDSDLHERSEKKITCIYTDSEGCENTKSH